MRYESKRVSNVGVVKQMGAIKSGHHLKDMAKRSSLFIWELTKCENLTWYRLLTSGEPHIPIKLINHQIKVFCIKRSSSRYISCDVITKHEW